MKPTKRIKARRIKARRVKAASLALVLAAAALWSTAAGSQESAEPLWSADMTVVEYSSVSVGAASADLFSNTAGSGDLKVRWLWSHKPGRDLRLAFEADVADAADYTLQVGALTLEFPAGSSGASTFKWTGVDVDWQDGQVIHVRIVPTAQSGAQPPNPAPNPVPTTTATPQPADGADQSGQTPQLLVANLGVNPTVGIMRPLSAARPGFAQAFTTGADTGGYTLGAVAIWVSSLLDPSAAGDHLQVTVNAAAGDGGPGDALCTLDNPSSPAAPAAIAFQAPTGADPCPQLAADTAYFAVIEWLDPTGTDDFAHIPQTYPTDDAAATEEDPGSAEGWSIADSSHYLTTSSEVRTWTAYQETASFKIKVTGTVSEHDTEPENTAPTGLPAITGTPQAGETLTADTSVIDDEDGLDNVEYEYQWTAGGADIDEAAAATYTPTAGDVGKTIAVRVTFTDDADNTETLTSETTRAVAAKPNTAPTGAPTISGTPQAGETLTAVTSAIDDEDGLDNVEYEYQWIAGGADIDGATAATYTPTAGDVGKTIAVRVTFADDADNTETLTSETTRAVAAVPLTVTVTADPPTTHDGSTEITFNLDFSEQFPLSYRTLKFHAFNVTGGEIKRAQRTNKPTNISWRITVEPDTTADITIQLPATTNCNTTGAICTPDGKKLSNTLSLTIKGPNPPTTCSPPQTPWACPAGGQLRPSTP